MLIRKNDCYFESEFEKKIQEFLEENKSDYEYSFEDAGYDATVYFGNDCEDYDAVAGMYADYATGDAWSEVLTWMSGL